VASLVDTNVLVCRFHGRFPEKQGVAAELLQAGAAEEKVYLPHQAVPDHGARHHRPITALREGRWVQLEGAGARVGRVGAVPPPNRHGARSAQGARRRVHGHGAAGLESTAVTPSTASLIPASVADGARRSRLAQLSPGAIAGTPAWSASSRRRSS
jgi:hypothetical protein